MKTKNTQKQKITLENLHPIFKDITEPFVDNVGHFEIDEFKFCPHCGAPDFSKDFGCGSCGGIVIAKIIESENAFKTIEKLIAGENNPYNLDEIALKLNNLKTYCLVRSINQERKVNNE